MLAAGDAPSQNHLVAFVSIYQVWSGIAVGDRRGPSLIADGARGRFVIETTEPVLSIGWALTQHCLPPVLVHSQRSP